MIRLGCFLSLVVIASGCRDGRIVLPTAPVAGTVTYQGKPLGRGSIVFFHPSGQAKGADIAADGAFKLVAFQGKNQITIELREPNGPDPNRKGFLMRGKSLVPEKYAEPGSSSLTFDVKPGENNGVEFVLKD